MTESYGDNLIALKKIVNDKSVWVAFNKTLDEKINQVHVKMEQVQGEADIYRCQGEVAALRKLKYLRDEINGGK
mgnify:FL=1|jgi:hypothetical protein|tara:strand:+ start:38 stop:259 length:222 start_codon:yes stop_codon:yes gene_type:complete